MAKRKKNTAQKQAARLELERDDLRERVTSENMRRNVLTKQNGNPIMLQYEGTSGKGVIKSLRLGEW